MQKGKVSSLFLAGLLGFTACVENKYNLSDVDTDDITIGDEWVAPLGTGVVKVTDLIDLDKVEQIKVDKNGNYIAIYSDYLEADLSDLINSGDFPFPAPANGKTARVDLPEGMVEVANTTVDIKETTDIFDAQDLVLSFTDPHILMETSSNVSSPLKARLDIVTGRPAENGNGGVSMAEDVSFNFTSLSNKLWVGPVDPKNSYIYQHANLDELIKIAPTYLNLILSIDPEDLEIPPLDAPVEALFVKLKYDVEIPFSPAEDFKAEMNQILEDAFDDDFVDYVFTSGSVEIFGTVSNNLPLRFSMNLVITDARNEPVGITIDPQEVAASQKDGSVSQSKVSFVISEKDMSKMVDARNIKIDFVARGDKNTEGLSLNEKQEIKLELKLKKKGGIVIN